MIAALGKGAREAYLEKHPHGFASNHKIHKSDKAYNRMNKEVTDIN